MYAPRHNAAGTLPIFRRERVSERGGAHTLKVMWQRGEKKRVGTNDALSE